MKPKLVIWGASGHALVVADIVRLRGEFEIVGLLDDVNPQRAGERFNGLAILGGREQLPRLKEEGVTHVTFGFGDCPARFRLASVIREAGFRFASAIHPMSAVAADASVAGGVVIAAGAVVNSGARIGANSIINSGASVDHECVIGEAVHLSPGVHLGGRVRVGDATWVCIGATVLDRIQIGARSIIGAGAVITRDVPEGVVVYGVPGKFVRSVAEQARHKRPPRIKAA